MISYEEALQKTIRHIKPLPSERIDLISAVGRIAAEDLSSRVDTPSADVSLKDGFAVQSSDIASASSSSPVSLRITGEIAAGGDWNGTVDSGEAVKILSGARIPEGADAVLAVEFTSSQGSTLTAVRDAAPGRNILFQGTDLHRHDTLLVKGAYLRPATLGLLAAGGHGDIQVYMRPRVGILATGDEVIAPGKSLPDGKLYASNLVTLAAWCAYYGCLVDTRIVPDEDSLVRDGLVDYLGKCDVLLTSGGAWKGDRDLVVHSLDSIGWNKIYHRVKIGPGKAVGFGLYEDKPVFCLPGGPPSNLMAFLQLALPGIKKLAGWNDHGLRTEAAYLTEDISGIVDWTQFIFGMLVREEEGRSFTPLRMKSRLSEMAVANAVAVIPEGVAEIDGDSSIQVQIIGALDPSTNQAD